MASPLCLFRSPLAPATCPVLPSTPLLQASAAAHTYSNFHKLRWSSVVSRSGRRSFRSRGLPQEHVEHSEAGKEQGTGPKQDERNGVASSQEAPASTSQLSALDAYFNKLQGSPAANGEPPGGRGGTRSPAANSSTQFEQVVSSPVQDSRSSEDSKNSSGAPTVTSTKGSESEAGNERKTKDFEALKALDAYFDRLRPKQPEVEKTQKAEPSTSAKSVEAPVEKKQTARDETDEEAELRNEVVDAWKKVFDVKDGDLILPDLSKEQLEALFADPWQDMIERAGPANLTNLFVAINIAVYLFELASPQVVPGELSSSLPSLFGAKVNELIVAGQLWRLVTPMFLHAGFFHLALGTWGLFAVGPAVEMAFGPLGFSLLYLLSGSFGNLMSFANTAAPTIGGTGPLYGLVGAYIVYVLKNRESIGKEKADGLARRVLFLSALNVALGNPPPIDDWTHIGSVLAGLLFAAVAAPSILRREEEKKKPPLKGPTDAWGRPIIEVQVDNGYTLEAQPVSQVKLGLAAGLSIGLFVALLQLGLSGGVNVLNLFETNDDSYL